MKNRLQKGIEKYFEYMRKGDYMEDKEAENFGLSIKDMTELRYMINEYYESWYFDDVDEFEYIEDEDLLNELEDDFDEFEDNDGGEKKVKTIIIQLSYHFSQNLEMTLNDLICCFNYIIDRYEVYQTFSNSADWLEVHNEEYTFVNTKSVYSIYANFDFDLKETYLKDLSATFDLGENLQNKIYDIDFIEVLIELDEIGILKNKSFSIERYLDWNKAVRNLRLNSFYIEEYEGMVIVHRD